MSELHLGAAGTVGVIELHLGAAGTVGVSELHPGAAGTVGVSELHPDAARMAAPSVVPEASGVTCGADRGSVLVIGYGNTLRRDDGVGVRAAELMAADPRFSGVEILTVYQLTPELSLDIGTASLVIFVDADLRGLPGAIEVRELGEGAAGARSGAAAGAPGDLERADPYDDAHHHRGDPGASSHHVGAGEVIALARELTGASPRAVAVGIGVADLELGEGLSAPVDAALPRVVDVVVRIIADHRSGGRHG